MTARVLVVDDILSNVKLLEAKLTAEYFEVVSAFNGLECLAKIDEAAPDIVLLDVMMPGMDGFEVCRRIKNNPRTAHIPVVMVTALDQPSDRVAGLDAGADDFLTKPVSDVALIARVRSLARLKLMTDELRMRAVTSRDVGIRSPEPEALAEAGRHGCILVVEDQEDNMQILRDLLTSAGYEMIEAEDGLEGVRAAGAHRPDLILMDIQLPLLDGYEATAELRRRETVLREAGAKDLVDMEARDTVRAPPSLLIVIDEFATLAKEVPDFVAGVVDVAQRGRSLGVHLILATQRHRSNNSARVSNSTCGNHRNIYRIHHLRHK